MTNVQEDQPIELAADSEQPKKTRVATSSLIKIRETRVGKGIFAKQDIAAETIIGEVVGEIMTNDHRSDYCIDLGGKALLEPEPPFRYLNHCCEPNCQLLQWKEQRFRGMKVPRIFVKAIRDVAASQELTIDYGWTAEQAIRCLCGAANCRGWVVAADERVINRARRMGLREKRS